jgi:hypothetical protein
MLRRLRRSSDYAGLITHVLRLAKKRSKGLCCHLKVCVSAGEKEGR